MKLVNKTKDKKEKTKKKNGIKPKKEHVLIVAQEIKFARLLSGNEKKTRDRVLKTLKKWLLNCFEKKYEFKEEDFIRVWKGLFYAVWMSDKPLIQEELCESIAAILDLFPPEQLKNALLMTKAGLKVLATDWYGIDQHRMDKFLMLVRRYQRGALRCVLRHQWSPEACAMHSHMLTHGDGLLSLETPHYARNATSMLVHYTDCFLEELAKVSGGVIPAESVLALLRPFGRLLGGRSPALVAAARRLHTQLLRQSAPGLRYQHKARAWEKMGCPVGGPDALELVSDEEEEGEGEEERSDSDPLSRPLDPRAGRVDVELSPLPTPAASLAASLRALLPHTTSKAYKRTKLFIDRFEQLSRDEYPLRVQCPAPPPRARSAARGAHALIALERKLIASADELALRGLSRKHRKRLLAKSRAGLSILEDLDRIRQVTNTATNDNWQIEPAPQAGKQPQDSTLNDHENKQKKNKGNKPTDARTDKHNKKRKMNTETTNKDVAIKRQKIEKKQKDIKEVDIKKDDHKHESNPNKPEKNKQADSKITIKTIDGAMDAIDKKIAAVKNISVANKQSIRTKSEDKKKAPSNAKSPTLVSKVKTYQKQVDAASDVSMDTPKKVKFVLKNNCMQKPLDYYKSVRQSPNIPFDSSKRPVKTNLKLSSPSPINPFFKKKLKLRK